MPLTPGSAFGAYQVIGAIGRGGMGEVFRAHDSKLGRDVAIKVLPGPFAADPDRRHRFVREAKLLASLNHPNIASIYGVEDVNDVLGLVLELVEGDTLAHRIAVRPLAVGEAVNIAMQIASALEAAHSAGIIHRDLKPANVKVTPDGRVKVLDFGLAKAMEREFEANPGETTLQLTEPGAVLGTAAYMSPEQARGLPTDKRSDVWAFGCVLFEMLTGRRAFGGDSRTETLVAIMREEPDWSLLPADTPAAVRRVLRRCIARDPQARLRDLGDAQMDLQDSAAGASGDAATHPGTSPHHVSRRAAIAAAAVIAVATAGIASGVTIWNTSAPTPAVAVERLAITIPQLESARTGAQIGLRAVVFVGRSDGPDAAQLYVRPLDAYEVRPLQGSEGASAPFFSPDGQSIAFFAGGKLRRMPVTGGVVTTICDAPDDSGGASGTWGANEIIVFAKPTSARAGLFRVPARGGTPEVLATPDPADEGGLGDPAFIPGTDWLLFATRTTKVGVTPSILIRSMSTGQQHKLTLSQDPVSGTAAAAAATPLAAPQYVSAGHVVFRSNLTIMAAPFRLDTGQATGPALAIADEVLDFDVSAAGRLVYVTAPSYGGQVVWVDRQGTIEPIDATEHRLGRPRLSPNASQLAVEVMRGDRSDIGVYRFASRAVTLLTTDGVSNSPVWHPDGRRMVIRNRGGLLWQPVDNTSPQEPFLMKSDPLLTSAASVAPGVFSERDPSVFTFALHGSAATGPDIFRLYLGPKRRIEPLVQRPGNQWAVRVSPDGKWIAYASDESGRFEVYVQSAAPTGGKYQASSGGGSEPVWAPSGNELFYWEGDRFMAVPISTNSVESPAGVPRSLFAGRYQHSDLPQYDVAPDGKRFVMIKASADDLEARSIRVVDGWIREFEQRSPQPR